jgi:hypothetical protein
MTASTLADVQSQPRHLTAVVHAADGIRFVATATCPAHLTAQVIDYIRARYDDVLWPPAAREVRALMDSGKPYAAIALYFAQVGDRWDEERLELGGISF